MVLILLWPYSQGGLKVEFQCSVFKIGRCPTVVAGTSMYDLPGPAGCVASVLGFDCANVSVTSSIFTLVDGALTCEPRSVTTKRSGCKTIQQRLSTHN